MLSLSSSLEGCQRVRESDTHTHRKANLYHSGFMGPGIYGTALALGGCSAGGDEKQTVIQDCH